jgi:hypothetical protein
LVSLELSAEEVHSMSDEPRSAPSAEKEQEASAVVDADPGGDRLHALVLVVRKDEALVLVRALSRRGTRAGVVAITELGRDAMV